MFVLKETPIPAEVPPPGSFYVNIPDGGSLNPQPVAYQPPTTYWNQPPVTYYQNAPAPTNSLPPSHHRFPFPTVGQPGMTLIAKLACIMSVCF